VRTLGCLVLGACGRIAFDSRPDAVTKLDAADPSPVVVGGSFFRSYDNAGDQMFTDMSHPATVSSFRLDRTHITVGQFRAFVAAGMGTQLSPPADGAGAHAAIANSGWDASWDASLLADTPSLVAALDGCGTTHTWTDQPTDQEELPLNCISWYEAFAFCIWDGGYLPSDAEWNYATSGGSEQRAFPWSTPPEALMVDSSYASYECVGDTVPGCALSDISVVGSKPAGNGRWGQADLGGDLYEWLLDESLGNSYLDPCLDCASFGPAVQRYARGGSYRDDHSYMRAGVRSAFDAYVRADVFGARCARPL